MGKVFKFLVLSRNITSLQGTMFLLGKRSRNILIIFLALPGDWRMRSSASEKVMSEGLERGLGPRMGQQLHLEPATLPCEQFKED